MYKLQMHSEWLIGDGGHILGMIFFKVKCLEYFGFGVKYSCDLFSFKANNLGLSNRMRKSMGCLEHSLWGESEVQKE